MGFWTWLKSVFSGASVPLSGVKFDEYTSLVGDIYIKELAFNSAVNLIANAVSKCEFKTYVNNNEVKGAEYYLWNYEPNKNQNSSAFIHKWIWQAHRYGEYLIVENNGQLLVADSFTRKPYALYEDVFTQVQVGDFTFNRTFTQSEVLYGQLNSQDMHRVVSNLYESYSKLIAYTMKAYKRSRGMKGIFAVDSIPQAGEAKEKYEKLINEELRKFLTSDAAVLPVGKGQEFKELNQRTYSQENTRDIRALIDDVSDFYAKAFCIPPALLRGDVAGTKDALDTFLTFCIDPLVDKLQEEINRKRNGRTGVLSGTYLKIDTKVIQHVDLLSVSSAIDKLIGSGAFCVNDIRKLVGEEPIDEDWANQHFITRNYMTFEEALKTMEGGEKT